MNSSEKNARIVCRMKSVDVTRVMPSRCAASVAIVDLPVPVAPPTSSSSGSSSRCSASSRRSRRTVRLRLVVADDVRRDLAQPIEVERRRVRAREIPVGAPRDRVRALRIEAGHDQRARHEALREGNLVAERERNDLAAVAHNVIPAISSRVSSSTRSGETGTTSFAASTTSAPHARACSATTSIAAAFSSTR